VVVISSGAALAGSPLSGEPLTPEIAGAALVELVQADAAKRRPRLPAD
jgi:hypothetical protein